MIYEVIKVEQVGKVGLLSIVRPEALNALNSQVMNEVVLALAEMDADDSISAMVITGSERAFAAGADVREMLSVDFAHAYRRNLFEAWDELRRIRKPIIAAVGGYALGGGCELAMMCDIIIAADNAKFGQPEITLGIIPGMGGTQRLTRAIGKAKAMDLLLTGRPIGAEEAEIAGLVSRVVPAAKLLELSMEIAAGIAEYSIPVMMMVKEAANSSFDTMLSEGLLLERRLFHSAFALKDREEGMAAFVEKRAAKFTNV